MCTSFIETLVLRNNSKYTVGCYSSVWRLVSKHVKCNYLFDKVRALLTLTTELAFTHQPAKQCRLLFLVGNANKALCSTSPLAQVECWTYLVQ